jgi:hypothetical protein
MTTHLTTLLRIRLIGMGRVRRDPSGQIAHGLKHSRLRMKLATILALVGAVAVSSCQSITGTTCNDTVAYQALEMTAKDSVTGVLVVNAVLKAIGQGADSATVSIGSDVSKYPVNLAGVGGTYAVSIVAPGYLTWSRTVVVTGGCVPKQVSLTAQMQKSL